MRARSLPSARHQHRGVAIAAVLSLLLALVAALAPPARADHAEVDSSDGLVTAIRWAGENRFDTAAKLAVEFTAAAVTPPAGSAVIARGDVFPDALAGAYLAGAVDGPVLLTRTAELAPETLARLESTEASGLDVSTIYLLGGQNAISPAVEQQLEDLGYTVVRLFGDDRFETAAAIAAQAPGATVAELDGQRTAIVARGDLFPDALVAGTTSYAGSVPILLTRTDELPSATSQALTSLEVERVLVAGGGAAVSDGVVAQIEGLGIEVDRVFGDDRAGTAAAFAQVNFAALGFTADKVGLARGDTFPDALAFGPYAGREGFSILLAPRPDVLGTVTGQALGAYASCTFDALYVPGGEAAVNDVVVQAARELLTPDADCSDVDNTAPSMVSVAATSAPDAAARTAQALPGPDDDQVLVEYDEAVTCTDAVPGQFVHTATDGTVTAATSLECSEGATLLLGFPGGTVGDPASGAITYTESATPGDRVTDTAGNEAVNGQTTAIVVLDLEVTDAADTRDADPGDGVCADDAGECTLRAAVDEANANAGTDRISLPAGTYTLTRTGGSEDANDTGDLDVLEGIVLEGAGADTTVVDAAGIDRAFDLQAGATRISDITVTGGSATQETDLIERNGGAILVRGGSLTLTDGVLADNEADRAGGGLENAGVTVDLVDTDLTGNHAGINGGGIHVSGTGTTSVSGGEVTGNSADGEGGGFWNNAGTMTVTGTSFDDNDAFGDSDLMAESPDVKGGGALFNNGGRLDVVDVTIANSDATGAGGSGGGILNDAGALNIAATTISDSTAVRAGGGIESFGDTATNQLIQVDLVGNEAGVNGGGLHVTGAGLSGIGGGSADGNVAGQEGGGLWNGSGTMTVEGMTLTNNVANGTEDSQGGGALFNAGGTLVVDAGTVVGTDGNGNTGRSGGGVMTDGGTLSVTGATIEDNTADRAGGGLEVFGTVAAPVVVTDTDFIGNDASAATSAGNGGAVHTTNQPITITGGTVDANTADEGGGFWNGSDTMVVDGVTFTANVALGNVNGPGGGALFNNGGTLDVDDAVVGTTDAGNVAVGDNGGTEPGSGGGLFVNGGTVTVDGTTFEANVADRAGGAIEVGSATAVTVTDTDFLANLATGDDSAGNGGAVHTSGGAPTDVVGGTAVGNAAVQGGAFWASGPMLVDGTTVTDNTATDQGGAFYNSGGVFTFVDVEATTGGLEVTEFDGTTAKADGDVAGHVYAAGAAVPASSATGSTFTDGVPSAPTCEETVDADALGNTDDDATCFGLPADAVVTVNSADDQVDLTPGDGVCDTGDLVGEDPECTLRAAIQEANTAPNSQTVEVPAALGPYVLTIAGADEDAGATGDLDVLGDLVVSGTGGEAVVDADGIDRVFDVIGASVELGNLQVTGGVAPTGRGGGVQAADGADLTIAQSTIVGNTAPVAGGGVENTLSTVSIETSTLQDNATTSTPGNGGGFHAQGGTTTVTDSVVETNIANEGGGLWVGASGSLTVVDTDVLGNVALGTDATAMQRQGGGGIFNTGSTLAVTGGTIDANTATAGAGSGGGIMTTDAGSTTVDGTTISDNLANRAGGGIESDGGSTLTVGATMAVTFTGNDAQTTDGTTAGNGGAIHAAGGTATITGGLVDGNRADEGGGFWIGGGGTMTVDGTTFTNNVADGDGDGPGGGALFNDGATLDVDAATIGTEGNGNTALGTATVAGSGGGIFANGGTLTVDDSTLTDNQADRAGGGIEVANVAGSATITDTDFASNDATAATSAGNGGAVHTTNQPITIVGGTVDGNTAVEGGGFWNGSATMSVDGTTFTNNVATGAAADQGGGALFDNGGTLTVINATIGTTGEANQATGAAGSGGGILAIGSLTLTDSTVTANTANRAGGGIEVNGATSVTVLTGVTMADNAIATPNPGVGGALHVTAGDVTVNGGSATGNTAVNGGGFWVNTASSLTVDGTTMTGNTATGQGGALFNNGGTLTVSNLSAATGNLDAGTGNVYAENEANTPSTTITSSTLEVPDVAGDACEAAVADLASTNSDGTCLLPIP